MNTEIHVNPRLVIERLVRALNNHDIEAATKCFDPLYHTEQPVHPDRAYRGREQIHKEWTATFKRLPDFSAKVLRTAVDHDVVWVEFHWSGMQKDKARVDMLGVAIFGVRENHLTWGRLYMEPVQKPGAGIEAVTG
jgi:predicted SnoaL-like aldol condensation-catalyzing enzyme